LEITHLKSKIENPKSFKLLGVRVDAVQIMDVVAQMEGWIAERRGGHFIAVTGMHGVMEAQHDRALKYILNSADLVVPDGMPLVWVGRLRGFSLKRRVYGPELMLEFCRATTGKGYRHFFYGGAEDVARKLARSLENLFGINVCGRYSPPFRPLTFEEDREIIDLINGAAPDVLWIGLSTPKQERWMYHHREKLNIPVLVGAGAAFDLNTGRVKQAPRWMREHGLEWFWRLLMEPRRLWRRYLIGGSEFVWCVTLELLGLKRFA
jgi:N-acetylglucosaminyldiphosphoundecaprenol N-acetyl-beta-D-mannosaminyltransferase